MLGETEPETETDSLDEATIERPDEERPDEERPDEATVKSVGSNVTGELLEMLSRLETTSMQILGSMQQLLAERAERTAETASMQQILGSLKQLLDERAERASMQQQIEAERAETASIQAEKASMQQQIEAGRAEMASIQAEKASIQAEKASIEQQIEAERAEMASLQQRLEKLEAQAHFNSSNFRSVGAAQIWEEQGHQVQVDPLCVPTWDDPDKADPATDELLTKLAKYIRPSDKEPKVLEATIQHLCLDPVGWALTRGGPLTYHSCVNMMPPDRGRQLPDVTLTMSGDMLSASSVVVVGELKPHRSQQHEGYAQLAHYMVTIMNCQPTRRLLWGFVTTMHLITFFKFTRGADAAPLAMYRSPEVSLANGGLAHLIRLWKSSPEQLGFVSLPRSSFNFQNEELTLERRLAVKNASDVYALPCYAGILKLVMQPFYESIALEKLNAKKVPGVPVLYRSAANALWLKCPIGTPLAAELCTAEILAQYEDTLRQAHACSVYHADVRPANLLVHAGEALLIDWGQAQGLGWAEPDIPQSQLFTPKAFLKWETVVQWRGRDDFEMLCYAVFALYRRLPWRRTSGTDELEERRRAWLAKLEGKLERSRDPVKQQAHKANKAVAKVEAKTREPKEGQVREEKIEVPNFVYEFLWKHLEHVLEREGIARSAEIRW
jgi:hypothetical protein